MMEKGAVVTVLCRTTHPFEYIRKKYPDMERGQRLKKVVIICCEMKKICKKRQDGSFSLPKTSVILMI